MTGHHMHGRLLKGIFYTFIFLVWLVGSVIFGGLVLSVKDAIGINIFSETGYHAFSSCVHSQYYKGVGGHD